MVESFQNRRGILIGERSSKAEKVTSEQLRRKEEQSIGKSGNFQTRQGEIVVREYPKESRLSWNGTLKIGEEGALLPKLDHFSTIHRGEGGGRSPHVKD